MLTAEGFMVMPGFLDQFRRRVVAAAWKDAPDESRLKGLDDKIAFGVLLWFVAEADNKFLPQEKEKIKDILSTHTNLASEDIPVILSSIKAAAEESIDFYQFTSQVKQNLPYSKAVRIIADLFRVACADGELDAYELETIRKIANLFHISHKDFIEAKLEIVKESGLET